MLEIFRKRNRGISDLSAEHADKLYRAIVHHNEEHADVLTLSDLLRSIIPVRLTTRLTDIILTHYNLNTATNGYTNIKWKEYYHRGDNSMSLRGQG